MATAPEPHPSTVAPPRPKRGRKAVLSREAIADAAVRLGFEGLTVAAVAEALGTSHATLYTHVRSRDDLLLAAADRVAELTRWPEPEGDWRTYLAAEAWALWDVLAAHPGLLRAIADVATLTPALVAHFAVVNRHLVALGFEPAAAVLASDTVFHLTADDASRRSRFVDMDPDARAELVATWSTPLDPGLRTPMADAIHGDPADWFRSKLDLVLAGIEATVAP